MTTLNALTDTKKQDAIKKALANGSSPDIRVVYPATDEGVAAAAAAWEKATALATADGLTVVSVPDEIKDADGNVTATPFEGNRTVLAGLMERREVEGKTKSAIIALVRFPMPTTESFMENGADWVSKLIEKEAAHVAFRRIRGSESIEALEQGIGLMPIDVDAYVKDYRGEGGVDTAAFDTMWRAFRANLIATYPALADALPPKGDVIKSIRSAKFAQENYPALESKKLFAFIGHKMVEAGPAWTDTESNEPDPQDVEPIAAWLAERDTFEFPSKTIDEAALASLSFDIGV